MQQWDNILSLHTQFGGTDECTVTGDQKRRCFVLFLAQLVELSLVKMLSLSVYVSVCLDVTQSGTNRNDVIAVDRDL